MSASFFQVVRASKDQLISALLGERPSASASHNHSDLLDGRAVEFWYRDSESDMPSAIVVSDIDVSDFFVWIETYAPQFSPITQHLRVLTQTEANWYLSENKQHISGASAVKRLTGLIMGEVIAQNVGDPMQALDAATLSQAQSTYSFSNARARLLWPERFNQGEMLSLFEDVRLQGLLTHRRVSPKELEGVWNIALGGVDTVRAKNGSENEVLISALGELSRSDTLSSDSLIALARYFEPARELISAEKYSAEDRVHAFDRLLTTSTLSSRASPTELFCIAYAAVGIGGGTTRHMNLLAEVGHSNPLVWLWFGLLGSIGRDAKWHPMFARLARLVSRELSYSFDVLEPPRADVDWKEARACGSGDVQKWLASIPRSQGRSAAIELRPGVNLTVSLNQSRSEPRQSMYASLNQPRSIDLEEFDVALAKLWELRQQLAGDGDSHPPKKATKRTRSRRTSSAKGGKLL